ncbi:MAG: hypothetical protein M1486_00325, partial [Gammaproteobacteria bacterium]|nr:hypothetical protein [Gammaproteobacteria bacterium]
MKLTILEIISTKGEMSIEDFDKTFDFLYTRAMNAESNARDMRRRMLYWLDSLGHCEIDYEKRRIYACKPSIVLLPGTGSRRAILTGARGPELLKNLLSFNEEFKDRLIVSEHPQEIQGLTIPSIILFEAMDEKLYFYIARILGIKFIGQAPAAWLIAQASGSLSEYESLLRYEPYNPMNWMTRTFSIEKLRFERNSDPFQTPTIIEYTHKISQQKIHKWVVGEKAALVDREWGRYLMLKYSGRNVIVYDNRKQLLAIPFSVSLPKLLSRAATLCSGRVPHLAEIENETWPMYVYRGVSESIAKIITKRIEQR